MLVEETVEDRSMERRKRRS